MSLSSPRPNPQTLHYSSLAWLITLLVVVGCSTYFISGSIGHEPYPPVTDSTAQGPRLIENPESFGISEFHGVVAGGSSFAGALATAGIDAVIVRQICSAFEGIDFDFRSCKPGQAFTAQTDSGGNLLRFRYDADVLNSYWILPDSAGDFLAQKYSRPVTEDLVSVEGSVETSVYHTIMALGEKPELIAAYADVLGYDIDFIFDPRFGDTFRILVSRRMLEGEVIGYGKILAAEYIGAETGEVRAFWYDDSTGKTRGWYAPDGRNVQRAFLRSPLSILRVTSTFGMRTHPISGKWKMHTGVDYGAPAGTPVWSVASGVVTHTGLKGGYGKMVEVSHPGNIRTRYAHLSRVLVKKGQAVRQQQRIGSVGSTGYSTAPHLHFEFLVNGRHTTQRKIDNPPLKQLPKEALTNFNASVEKTLHIWKKAKPIRVAEAIAQR